MRREWQLGLEVDRGASLPPFLQIARALTDDIRRGRLRPGARLPGSRSLAGAAGVHRNTVIAACAELVAEGWLETAPGRGTFVARALPEPDLARRPRDEPPRRAGFPVPDGPEAYRPPVLPRGTLNLSSGEPDPRLVPAREIGRAYRRVLARRAGPLLGYGDPEGHPALRAALASMLADTRALPAGAGDVVVTRGSQMALALVARALLRPGDVVAVESLGYRPAWEAFRAAGARVVPVPVDAAGLDVAALARIIHGPTEYDRRGASSRRSEEGASSLAVTDERRTDAPQIGGQTTEVHELSGPARTPARAVYLTPHHQYPTTVTLTAARRLELLALARRARLAVIEDDYDHEFHYDGRPVLPLASADPGRVVIYVGTLSKVLAPGLRLGYVVAPPEVVQRVAALRSLLDIQGDHATEAAIAAMMEDGELSRHVARARRVYAERRHLLAAALRRAVPDAELQPPSGGMALWVRFTAPVDVERWARRSLERGVWWHTGRRYAFDGRPLPCARFSFAGLDERELAEAVRRLAAARPR